MKLDRAKQLTGRKLLQGTLCHLRIRNIIFDIVLQLVHMKQFLLKQILLTLRDRPFQLVNVQLKYSRQTIAPCC